MGGFFGVVSRDPCVDDLFYGTDYHSHLGTRRGGLATLDAGRIHRFIHNIENAQFRSKFEDDVHRLHGRSGIGVISDTEEQPVIVRSHLGTYAIVTVGKLANLSALAERAFSARQTHFAEMGGGGVNPSEVVASIINRGGSFVEGVALAQEEIEGSCSMLLLTEQGIYAARDRFGRTPVVIGRKDHAFAATMETCAFPNLEYEVDRFLGPGEIVLLTEDGMSVKRPAGPDCRICAFLWVYYGYPASSYEGVNVEACRNRCGAALARRDDVTVDCVAGIPDSGIGHAVGYASERGLPYRRPYVKYTPTWPRSFMPQDQSQRDLVARMKLVPIRELVDGQRLLFCEDSIVRGTQLKDTIRRLFDAGAAEVHMRPACPPLVHGCRFLNFSQSKSELDLAARRAVQLLEGEDGKDLAEYADPRSGKHAAMVEEVRRMLGLTSLRYQLLGDLVEAIGLPKDRLCTFCWDGVG
jgi:amidophosphoribosyltransferase